MNLANLSYSSRIERYKLFESECSPGPEDKILYIGGAVTGNIAKRKRECFFYDAYKTLENVTVLDVNLDGLKSAKKLFPAITIKHYQGGRFPFKDKEFDIVFCNAVIEHVGGWQNQKIFAEEITRVSKKWFVTTPNIRYPFEFHYRLPFIHYFSKSKQHFLKQFIGGRFPRGEMPEPLDLLSKGKMKKLFPHGKIILQRITFWPEIIIAVNL